MPIQYRIFPGHKVAYIKAWGKLTIDEILTEGAKMFAETEWKNGFNILCDYQEVTGFNPTYDDIRKIVNQDKHHEPLFNNSKCAVVAKTDLVFGLSRMWEILSENTNLEKMVFRDIHQAKDWLCLDAEFTDSLNKPD